LIFTTSNHYFWGVIQLVFIMKKTDVLFRGFFPLALITFLLACGLPANEENNLESADNAKETRVEITTDYGKIVLKLYNETPKHRDNFIKLVNEGFYNGTLFHRVIKNFMIQGGDPESKNAKPMDMLGNGGPGYTLPNEILPQLFHKKGALAAARLGDDVNPDKNSSGSQFYIVQGNVFTNDQLNGIENRINEQNKSGMINSYLMKPENADLLQDLRNLYNVGKQDSVQSVIEKITPTALKDFKPYSFSEEQRKVYTTIGGSPHLDGGYTVFGEVVEGLDVIDKIAAEEVDQLSRPRKDVVMQVKIIKK
jgi:cyclophilin family peptidyl-prolyl cis-trans isomerase